MSLSDLILQRESKTIEFKKEPSIEEKGDFVDVEISRPQDTKTDDNQSLATDYERKPPETAGILSEQEKIVLEHIYLNKTITAKEVEKLLNLKDRRVREILSQMLDKKVIKRSGSGRSTYYEVAK